MTTAYHSVPQASGPAFSAQGPSKLLMCTIPNAGIVYKPGVRLSRLPINVFQTWGTVNKCCKCSINQWHRACCENRITNSPDNLIVRKKNKT